jgi:hypothetical protein
MRRIVRSQAIAGPCRVVSTGGAGVAGRWGIALERQPG